MDKKKINIEELEAANEHIQDLDMAITRNKQFFSKMTDQYLAKKILENMLSADEKPQKPSVDSWLNLAFAGICAIVGIASILITLNYNGKEEYKEISKDIHEISTKATVNDVRINNNAKAIESLEGKIFEIKHDVTKHGEAILELKEKAYSGSEKYNAK